MDLDTVLLSRTKYSIIPPQPARAMPHDSGYAHNHVTVTVTKYQKCKQFPKHKIQNEGTLHCTQSDCQSPARQHTGSASRQPSMVNFILSRDCRNIRFVLRLQVLNCGGYTVESVVM